MSEVSTILNVIQEGMAKVPKEEQKELAWWLILMNLMDMKDLDGTMTDKEKQEYQQLNQSFKANAKPVKMTKKQAREYVMGLLHELGKAGFEKDNPNEDNNDVLRERFTGYMTAAVKFLIRITELMGESRSIKDKDLSQWVQEYVDEVYPPSPYAMTVQGEAINALMITGRKGQGRNGNTITTKFKGARLYFLDSQEFGDVAMTPPMVLVEHLIHEKLVRVIDWKALEQGGRGIVIKNLRDFFNLNEKYNIEITSEEFMAKTKAKSEKKEVTKRIGMVLERLCKVGFETDRGNLKGVLFQTFEKKRGGVFKIYPSEPFLRYCLTTTPADINDKVYQIDYLKYKYALPAYFKLYSHFMINRGKKNCNRLQIANLLDILMDLPTYDYVMEHGRHVRQQIIDPVERDLAYLMDFGLLTKLEYSQAKGVPLNGEVTAGLDYNEWKQLYVTFELDLPPQDGYIKAHQDKVKRIAKDAAIKRQKSKKVGD